MDKEVKRILSEGLQSGYAGTSKKEVQARGNFVMSSRNLELEGATYHDEWVARTRTGGGQELVKVWSPRKPENVEATRVYSGGIFPHEILDPLGVTEKDIVRYLKTKLKELGMRTRLDQDCSPEPDGDWQYSYKILKDEIPVAIKDNVLVMGLETIAFRKQLIFAHGFVISPIE